MCHPLHKTTMLKLWVEFIVYTHRAWHNMLVHSCCDADAEKYTSPHFIVD